MKILVVHEIDYEHKVIYEVHELAELLEEHGDSICFLDYAEEKADKKFFSLGNRRRVSGRVRTDTDIELISPAFFGRSGVARLSAVFTVLIALPVIFIRFRPDVVLNYAVPTYGPQVALFCKIFQTPMIHRALDSSHKIRRSFWNPLIREWEKIVFRSATAVSTHNKAMRSYIQKMAPKAEVLVHFPPIDLDFFRPQDVSRRIRNRFGITDDKRIITYMGSFFHFSGIPQCLEAIANMSGRSDFHLVLIGGGEQESFLRKEVCRLGLKERVHFYGFAPFQDLPALLSESDVCINPMEKSLVSDVALPHKVLQYLSSGRPVVSTRLDGLVSSLPKGKAIQFVESPEEVILSAVEMLGSQGPDDQFMAKFRNSFDRKECVRIIREALESKVAN